VYGQRQLCKVLWRLQTPLIRRSNIFSRDKAVATFPLSLPPPILPRLSLALALQPLNRQLKQPFVHRRSLDSIIRTFSSLSFFPTSPHSDYLSASTDPTPARRFEEIFRWSFQPSQPSWGGAFLAPIAFPAKYVFSSQSVLPPLQYQLRYVKRQTPPHRSGKNR
jgi:hypothetical protein